MSVTLHVRSIQENISNWHDIKNQLNCIENQLTWFLHGTTLFKRLFKHTTYHDQFCLEFVFKVVRTLKKDVCY